MDSVVHNTDCLEAMRAMPDKAFDLAVVDPPYGIEKRISLGGGEHTKNRSRFHVLYSKGSQWDFRPTAEYWKELFRVSNNQMVCGGNYFTPYLPISRGWIIWDKEGDGMSSVNNEMIFTSFDVAVKTFRRCHGLDKGFQNKHGVIHPTQKPVALYKWLLTNYAKPGDRILDTHLGSGSSRIAAYDLGFAFEGYELDKDYYDAQEKRFADHIAQPKLFSPQEPTPVQEAMFAAA